MPRAPRPLPASLDEIFLRRDAGDAGLRLGRLRRNDLERRVRGVRAPAGAADDFRMRCRMFQRRLGPTTFVSHSSAALLVGAPLPRRLETGALHMTVPAPARAPHAEGIVGHSRRVLPGDVVVRDGIRHSSPARLWCELGRALSLGDLVAVADHLIHHREPLTTVAELAERLTAGDRITRSPLLRAALGMSDSRAESAQESRLRVLLALDGIHPTSINHTIIATDGGRNRRPDFTFGPQRVVLEYQGDHHRTKKQWREDMTRRSQLEAQGWRVVELNADDLLNPRELTARVRALLARASR